MHICPKQKSVRVLLKHVLHSQNPSFLLDYFVFHEGYSLMLFVNLIYQHLNHDVFSALVRNLLGVISVFLNFLLQEEL